MRALCILLLPALPAHAAMLEELHYRHFAAMEASPVLYHSLCWESFQPSAPAPLHTAPRTHYTVYLDSKQHTAGAALWHGTRLRMVFIQSNTAAETHRSRFWREGRKLMRQSTVYKAHALIQRETHSLAPGQPAALISKQYYTTEGSYFLDALTLVYIPHSADRRLPRGPGAAHLIPFSMGEHTVYMESIQKGKGPLIVVIHPDESSAMAASREIIHRRGGRALLFLGNDPEQAARYFTFGMHGRAYYLDPNRIFDPLAMRSQFTRNRSQHGPALHNTGENYTAIEARLLADTGLLTDIITDAHHIQKSPGIFVHDNYHPMHWSTSILNGSSSSISQKAFKAPGKRLQDFFYITRAADFDRLTQKGYNVILQNNHTVPRDGSASVYFADLDMRYFCLEAGRDAAGTAELIRMLETLYRLLD